MSDVIIIGAGVIGLSIALELAKRGTKVRLLDRGAPGAEASSAAAGVLGVQHDLVEDGPFARLCFASIELFPRWAAALVEATGIDVGYRRSGGLAVALTEDQLDAAKRDVAWQASIGYSSDVLDGDAARSLEPGFCPEVVGAVRFASDARVDPPSLVKALRFAAERAGVEVRAGAYVRRVIVEGDRARGVVLADGSVERAAVVVLAAGSWSALIEGAPLREGSVRPARGQIIELLTGAPHVRHIVYGPGFYLSPRDDGRLLVGSTMEDVGFRPGVTAGAVEALLAAAFRVMPSLAEAGVGRLWSGFRPRAEGDLPLLGATSIPGFFVATGHFRSGVILAPITAAIMANLIEGSPSPVDSGAFSARRACI